VKFPQSRIPTALLQQVREGQFGNSQRRTCIGTDGTCRCLFRLSILPVLDGTSPRDYATSAIRDWVPWRLLYNMLLAVVVVVTYWLNLPSFKAAVIIDSACGFFRSRFWPTLHIALHTLSIYSYKAPHFPILAAIPAAVVCARSCLCGGAHPVLLDGIFVAVGAASG